MSQCWVCGFSRAVFLRTKRHRYSSSEAVGKKHAVDPQPSRSRHILSVNHSGRDRYKRRNRPSAGDSAHLCVYNRARQDKGIIEMKVILGAMIGAAVGYAVGYFGRCASGTCPLTGNPVVSAMIGAMIGAMVTLGR